MNWLDVAFLVVLVVLTVLGWHTGVHWAGAVVGGALLGLSLATKYNPSLAESLGFIIAHAGTAKFIAFGAILLGTLALVVVGAELLRRGLKLVFLGWVESLAGAMLGLALGLAMVSVFSGAACRMPIGVLQGAVTRSVVASSLQPLVGALLPGGLEEFSDPDTCSSGGSVPL